MKGVQILLSVLKTFTKPEKNVKPIAVIKIHLVKTELGFTNNKYMFHGVFMADIENLDAIVVSIPEGHGRFQYRKNIKTGNVVLLACYAENYGEPGVPVTDTNENVLPVIGITVPSTQSARAWAKTFFELADCMENNRWSGCDTKTD